MDPYKLIRYIRKYGLYAAIRRAVHTIYSLMGNTAPNHKFTRRISLINKSLVKRKSVIGSKWHIALVGFHSKSSAAPQPEITVVIDIPDARIPNLPILFSLLSQDYPLRQINLILSFHHSDDRFPVIEARIKDREKRLFKSSCVIRKENIYLSSEIKRSASEFVLHVKHNIIIGKTTISTMVSTALVDNREVDLWGGRQLGVQSPDYCDPVTLETFSTESHCMLSRSEPYLFSVQTSLINTDPPSDSKVGSKPLIRHLQNATFTIQSEVSLLHLGRSVLYGQERPSPLITPPPLISVITRHHGQNTDLLAECIVSILNQTHRHIEHLIIEDRGYWSANIINQTAQQYGANIRHIRSLGSGRVDAANAGLAAATGQYIMFLDNDDLCFPEHVEILMSLLQKYPEKVAAYSPSIRALTKPLENGTDVEISHQVLTDHRREFDRAHLMERNYIAIQALMFRRELYDMEGGMDPRLDHLEDWNLWARYALYGDFAFSPQPTSLYRISGDELSQAARRRQFNAAYPKARRLLEQRRSEISGSESQAA